MKVCLFRAFVISVLGASCLACAKHSSVETFDRAYYGDKCEDYVLCRALLKSEADKAKLLSNDEREKMLELLGEPNHISFMAMSVLVCDEQREPDLKPILISRISGLNRSGDPNEQLSAIQLCRCLKNHAHDSEFWDIASRLRTKRDLSVDEQILLEEIDRVAPRSSPGP
jgi:hypothetical protein